MPALNQVPGFYNCAAGPPSAPAYGHDCQSAHNYFRWAHDDDRRTHYGHGMFYNDSLMVFGMVFSVKVSVVSAIGNQTTAGGDQTDGAGE
jgi:hypothetical protein